MIPNVPKHADIAIAAAGILTGIWIALIAFALLSIPLGLLLILLAGQP
jgi:hypothetical protein